MSTNFNPVAGYRSKAILRIMEILGIPLKCRRFVLKYDVDSCVTCEWEGFPDEQQLDKIADAITEEADRYIVREVKK